MQNSTTTTSPAGISTTGLLGVLFIGLKLTGFIDWPWLWVLAPFWIPLAVLLAILFAIAVVWVIAKIAE